MSCLSSVFHISLLSFILVCIPTCTVYGASVQTSSIKTIKSTKTSVIDKTVPSCPLGTIHVARGCQKCPPGTYGTFGGLYSTCVPCPRNTFTPFSGVTDYSLCQVCRPDSFSGPGSRTCRRCPRGYVRTTLPLPDLSSSPRSNSNVDVASALHKKQPQCRRCHGSECTCAWKPSGCNYDMINTGGKNDDDNNEELVLPRRGPCPYGFVLPLSYRSYFPKSTCVSAVSGCPKGTVLKTWSRRALCKQPDTRLVICPDPNSRFDGIDRCISCYPGSRLKYNEDAQRLQCHLCDGQSVSNGGATMTCTKCPEGYVKTADLTKCFNPIPPKFRKPKAA